MATSAIRGLDVTEIPESKARGFTMMSNSRALVPPPRAPSMRGVDVTELPESKSRGFTMLSNSRELAAPPSAAPAAAPTGSRALVPTSMRQPLPMVERVPTAAAPLALPMAATPPTGGLRGSSFAQLARKVPLSAPAAVGALAGAAGQSANIVAGRSSPALDPNRPVTATGAGAVPRAPDGGSGLAPIPTDIERAPLGIGGNTELTRGIANTVNALPGVGPAAGMFRAGSNGMRAGMAIDAGLDAVRGAQLGAAAAPALVGAATAAPQAIAPSRDVPNEGRTADPSIGPQLPAAGADTRAYRVPGRMGVSSMSADGMRSGTPSLEAAAADSRMAAAGRQEFATPGLGGFGGGSLGGGADSAHNQNFDMEVAQGAADSAMRLGGKQGTAQAAAILEAANKRQAGVVAERGAGSAERIASMREAGDTQRANAANDVTMRGQDSTAATQRRGQDGDFAEKQLAVKASQEAAARNQANLDRSFKLDVAKVGMEQAEKNRTAGAEAMKAHQTRLENSFRDAEGKPDMVKIADYNQSVDTTLPAMVKLLRQTNTAEAQAKATELEQRQHAALTPGDHDDLMNLFRMRELSAQSAGMLPGSGTHVDSRNLLDFRQRGGADGVDDGLIEKRINFAGGSSIGARTLRGGTPVNSFNPNPFAGGSPTRDFTRGLRGVN